MIALTTGARGYTGSRRDGDLDQDAEDDIGPTRRAPESGRRCRPGRPELEAAGRCNWQDERTRLMAILTFRADGGARVSRSTAAGIVQGFEVRGLLCPLRAGRWLLGRYQQARAIRREVSSGSCPYGCGGPQPLAGEQLPLVPCSRCLLWEGGPLTEKRLYVSCAHALPSKERYRSSQAAMSRPPQSKPRLGP